MRIYTDDESLEVDGSIESLIEAMRFKAEHIKAKADPALFDKVADTLERLNCYLSC